MNRRLGLAYGLLVSLLVLMGVWWVYFLTREGDVHAQYRRRQLTSDSLHAAVILQNRTAGFRAGVDSLAATFPDLVFTEGPGGVAVGPDPDALAAIAREARATSSMFLYEGIFFLLLLAGGLALLIQAWQSEIRFKRARELFLAGATHEFKTPLASLRLYTETLGRQGLADQAAQVIRRRMVEDITRLESLVDNMLAMSADVTLSPGPRRPIDLGQECRAVAQDLAVFAQNHDAVIEVLAPAGASILGHHHTFVLALRNLVVNAIVHNRPPVHVRLEVSPGPERHRLTVRDDGSGIPRRLQEKIFDCFYSGAPAPGKVGGAGLGLYLVKRHTRELGGRIELASEPGQGSAFTLILPALRADGQGATA